MDTQNIEPGRPATVGEILVEAEDTAAIITGPIEDPVASAIPPGVRAALAATDVRVSDTIAVAVHPVPSRVPVQRGGTVQVIMPPAPHGRVRAILDVNAAGRIEWHLPHHGGTVRVPVPNPDTAVPATEAGRHGPHTELRADLRRVLHVLDIPATIDGGLSAWELRHRPYRLYKATGAITDAPPPDDTPLDIPPGRALLLLHGTGSTGRSGFGGLMRAGFWARLAEAYPGRILVFDHPTLTESPDENADRLLALLPPGRIDLDVIGYSRGGLLARVLANRAAGRITIGTTIHVAAPHAGTRLAGRADLKTLANLFTAAAAAIPDLEAVLLAEAAVQIVSALLLGVNAQLTGILAMDPASPWLAALPGAATATTYAIGGDFEPGPATPAGLRLADLVVDQLFANVPNDLIVPTASAFASRSGTFTIAPANRLTLPPAASIDHFGYFAYPDVQARLADWLAF